MTLGAGVTCIQGGGDDTEGFFDNREEVEKLFGTGNIGPDRIRLMTKYTPKNPNIADGDDKIVNGWMDG